MITEIKTCRCGLEMPEVKGIAICPNCDVLQPQEVTCVDCDRPGQCTAKPQARSTTVFDRRFELAWVRLMREFYPGQSK